MRIIKVLVLATTCSLMVMAGYGAFLTFDASREIYDEPNDTAKVDFERDDFLADMAYRYALMALFAEMVYRAELAKEVRDDQGCSYLNRAWPGDARHGMPRQAGPIPGWERWTAISDSGPPCWDKKGLFYETYVYRDNTGTIQEAVIAFRGTENRKGATTWDWTTNLAVAFGVEPAQYKTARAHIPALIKRLKHPKDGNPQVRIYAVGHFLGGGLAQQAGYLSKDIKEVYTFNTTPVTNWTNLRREGLVRQAYPVIHRVYHGGEALESIRFVATSATAARFGRHDIGLQFGERAFAKGHSMKVLACNFAGILSRRGVAAGAHYYPKEYIDAHVLKEGHALRLAGGAGHAHRICKDDA